MLFYNGKLLLNWNEQKYTDFFLGIIIDFNSIHRT